MDRLYRKAFRKMARRLPAAPAPAPTPAPMIPLAAPVTPPPAAETPPPAGDADAIARLERRIEVLTKALYECKFDRAFWKERCEKAEGRKL